MTHLTTHKIYTDFINNRDLFLNAIEVINKRYNLDLIVTSLASSRNNSFYFAATTANEEHVNYTFVIRFADHDNNLKNYLWQYDIDVRFGINIDELITVIENYYTEKDKTVAEYCTAEVK